MIYNKSFRDYWYEYIKEKGKVTAPELLDYTESVLGLQIDSETRNGKLNSIRGNLDDMVQKGRLNKIEGGIYFLELN